MVLKLYVWENVLCDYTCGIAFCIAENLEEAIKLITQTEDGKLMSGEELASYKVHDLDEKVAYARYGGG